MTSLLRKFWSQEEGQDIAEYLPCDGPTFYSESGPFDPARDCAAFTAPPSANFRARHLLAI